MAYNKKWHQAYQKNNREKRKKWEQEHRKKNLKKIREKEREYAWEHRENKKAYIKEWKKKNKPRMEMHRKMLRKKYPQKTSARNIASKRTRLKSACEICGSKTHLQRHHWRYDKPLLINTLCKDCHNIQHLKFFKKKYPIIKNGTI